LVGKQTKCSEDHIKVKVKSKIKEVNSCEGDKTQKEEKKTEMERGEENRDRIQKPFKEPRN
jgi:hypothetical protein